MSNRPRPDETKPAQIYINHLNSRTFMPFVCLNIRFSLSANYQDKKYISKSKKKKPKNKFHKHWGSPYKNMTLLFKYKKALVRKSAEENGLLKLWQQDGTTENPQKHKNYPQKWGSPSFVPISWEFQKVKIHHICTNLPV